MREPQGPPKRANNEYHDKLYQQHIRRLKQITARLSTQPARVNVANIMKLGNIMSDIEGFNQILHYNVALLRILNETKSKYLDGFSTKKIAAGVSKFDTPAVRNEALKLYRENRMFAYRLEGVSNRNCEEDRKAKSKALKCQAGKFKLPEQFLAKYEGKVALPPETCLQFKLLRPSIFFDLEAKNERPIGRITFQLYTEACPMVILELLKIFANKQHDKLKFPRVYPYLWAECDITVDGRNFNYAGIECMRALDNGIGMGIISVDVGKQGHRYLKEGVLVLVISFKPLPVLNGRRVAIGRITNGRRNLTGLSEYGTKNGKPLKHIVITQLGIVDN